MSRIVSVAVLTALSAVPASLRAQSHAGDTPTRVASINPFIVLFGFFSGEYEQRASRSLAWGIAGSTYEFDDDRRANVDLKVRLYPNERVLQGFGLGASVGWTQLRNREYLYPDYVVCSIPPSSCDPTVAHKTYNAPSVAIEISYQWLLGSHKSTAVIVGGGAKRAFTSADKWGFEARILPTGRLSIGYAF